MTHSSKVRMPELLSQALRSRTTSGWICTPWTPIRQGPRSRLAYACPFHHKAERSSGPSFCVQVHSAGVKTDIWRGLPSSHTMYNCPPSSDALVPTCSCIPPFPALAGSQQLFLQTEQRVAHLYPHGPGHHSLALLVLHSFREPHQ